MTSSPAVAVLIACHNRRAKTLGCLDALAAQKGDARLQAFVLDDGCTDGTAAAIRAHHPATTILDGDGQAFWAGGMRRVFDHALTKSFDHYLWLNDDVVLEPDAVSRLLATADDLAAAGHHLAVIGGAVRDPRTGAFTYGGIARRSPRLLPLRFAAVTPSTVEPRRCDTLHGNIVLIPRATAARLGSIGRAFVHTLGDLDYGLRVGRLGGAVVLAPGFFGSCEGNPRAQRWFDLATPLGERWRALGDPRGFPPRPWIHFARTHGGQLWPVFALLPFWRLAVPARFATLLLRRHRARRRVAA